MHVGYCFQLQLLHALAFLLTVGNLRIGMTCDPVENLQQWVKDAIELTGSSDEETGFTIIADSWLGKGKIRDIWEVAVKAPQGWTCIHNGRLEHQIYRNQISRWGKVLYHI